MNSKPTTQIDIKRKLKTRNGIAVFNVERRARLITGTVQLLDNIVRHFWNLDGMFDPVNGPTEMDLVCADEKPNDAEITPFDIKRPCHCRNGWKPEGLEVINGFISGTIGSCKYKWFLNGSFDLEVLDGRLDLVYDKSKIRQQEDQGQECGPIPPTPCCQYYSRTTYPVYWNPDNKVVQCHNCGQVYEPANRPPQAFDGDRIENCVRLIASMDQRITRIEGAIEYGVLKGILK